MPKEPDLPEDSPEFRRELKRVARGWAWSGLALSLGGVAGALLVSIGDPPRGGAREVWACLAVMVLGWGLLGVAIARRTRHYRAFVAANPL